MKVATDEAPPALRKDAALREDAGRARLQRWRDDGRQVFVYFTRNFFTGAPTSFSFRGRIIAADQRLDIAFDGGALRVILINAQIFDGPIVFVDVDATLRDEREAVQVKPVGGDSILISLEAVADADLLTLTSPQIEGPREP